MEWTDWCTEMKEPIMAEHDTRMVNFKKGNQDQQGRDKIRKQY